AVKAFVAPVLLRFARRDAIRADPELHPPGRQAREAREPARGKRGAVIRAQRPGQAIRAKRPLEDGARVGQVDAAQDLAGERVATRRVRDRERLTALPVARAPPALEIGAPELVGPRQALKRRR